MSEDSSDLILVVDDDAMVRLLVTRILEQAGYRSLAVSGALEALSTLEAHASRVSLVLTDILMPDRHGIWLGREIGARWPAIPVVYMSGYAPEALVAKGIETPTVLVAKPFTIEELLAAVERILSPSPLERRHPGGRSTPPPSGERRRARPGYGRLGGHEDHAGHERRRNEWLTQRRSES